MAFGSHLAAADRAVLSQLGDVVRYWPEYGDPVDVVGVFSAQYVRVDVGGAGVSSVSPAVFLRLADLPDDPEERDARVSINGTDYKAREVQKDGQGGVLLLLIEA